MNRLDIPVYIGENKPLKRDSVNALDTHGADGLGESFLPRVLGYQQEIGAVDFLADVLKKEKVMNGIPTLLYLHPNYMEDAEA